jgi:energy-coupling factor transporter ATP-binding protein EcfA2
MPTNDEMQAILLILLAVWFVAVSLWKIWQKIQARVDYYYNEIQTERAARSALPVKPATTQNVAAVTAGVTLYDASKRLAGKNSIHLLLVGETGSGKSTAAKYLYSLRGNYGDKILIIDPHSEPGDWPQRAIGQGRDYQEIETTLQGLIQEMDARYQARGKGKTDYPAVTIFIDEYPAIAKYCPSAKEFLTTFAMESRKVQMRLIILTQSQLVESLGLKGQGDIRENFSYIVLGQKARAVMPELVGNHIAVFQTQGQNFALDTTGFVQVQLPQNAEYNLPPQALTSGSSTSSQGATVQPFEPKTALEPLETALKPVLEPVLEPDISDDEAIRELLKIGTSANEICKVLGGNKAARLAQIRAIKEAVNEVA